MKDKTEKHSIIASGKFVTLCQVETEDYKYEYSVDSRCDGELVAVLPYYYNSEINSMHVVVHMETTPCWGGDSLHVNSITGGFERDKHSSATDAARAELSEEAGIVADMNNMKYIGGSHLGKSSANIVHMFKYIMSDSDYENFIGREIHTCGDGSWLEQQSHSVMYTVGKAVALTTDPILSTMILKLKYGM